MFGYCCEKSNYKMSSAQNLVLRITIVLGMMVAVMAILFLTPLPEQNFKSCDRPCHDLDWPMICRAKLYVESIDDIKNCINCSFNLTKGEKIVSANRQIPGPLIEVCKNDILVVDVINKIQGHSLTLHWHGQPNHEAPFMDGVPLVTQCPIPSYTTFQYKFRASHSGTHLYHAYSDHDRSLGLFGALIVRESDKSEPHRKLYDIDSKNHIILISESTDNTLLINGKGPHDVGTLSIFNVKRNKRYRFRVGYAGGKVSCPTTLTIDNHQMKIIALDGNPTNPYEVDSLKLNKGERIDFVLKTNQHTNGYFLRVNSCVGEGLAVINYDGSRKSRDGSIGPIPGRNFDTAPCESKIGRLCLTDVKSLRKIPEELKRPVKKVMYLPIGSRIVNVNGEFSTRIFGISNLTFIFPSSPLLTQLSQISLNSVCDELNIPESCLGKDICECIHVEYIPLGALTEIILINQDIDDDEHVFHLHGHHFYLIGSRQFDKAPIVKDIKMLNKQNNLLKRNFNNPVLKDTIRIPKFSVVAIRFIANNPGFWMFRDEKSKGWTRGMDIVLQVGDSTEMVSTPSNFPTCGNYIGPEFFLM